MGGSRIFRGSASDPGGEQHAKISTKKKHLGIENILWTPPPPPKKKPPHQPVSIHSIFPYWQPFDQSRSGSGVDPRFPVGDIDPLVGGVPTFYFAIFPNNPWNGDLGSPTGNWQLCYYVIRVTFSYYFFLTRDFARYIQNGASLYLFLQAYFRFIWKGVVINVNRFNWRVQ